MRSRRTACTTSMRMRSSWDIRISITTASGTPSCAQRLPPKSECGMFGSVLEVAIGVVFVFLLASIICSAVREGIEAFLKTRAAYLERGIRELLHDRDAEGLARQVYTHPLVAGMYRD